ncbi:thiol:disulfide interchange protein precursor [Fuerstiella marisgermanici]|uniref:Thiol:disulfide interchange protein n=2 Tax=Fuerstiella marisgermanici TaxID=1891926 RepID=A0A1P8WG48_9PLAN|nr:thioredoxin family protein [Fuerstiella marisgermanici]APZ93035.1 thiol:disulfide interchange protein precursor [Fuerstiella marisgermanici]
MPSYSPQSQRGRSYQSLWRVLAIFYSALLVSGCGDVPTEQSTDRASGEERSDARPIVFGHSISVALEEAKQSNRRVLVYFTGPSCLWCRVMEEKTHSDPIIRDLASRFVCVKVSTTEFPGVQEDYGVFTIPRTMVLTADNEKVTDCVGFEPPDQHAERLRAATDSPPLPPASEVSAANIIVSASVAAADLVFWFVDSTTTEPNERVNDHTELLSYLRDNGFKPRIEHVPRSQLKSRRDESNERGRIPDLLVASNRSGLIRQLMRQGVTRDAISTRLRFESIPAVCDDFAMQNVWLLPDSANHHRAAEAMNALFDPPASSSSGTRRFTTRRSEVEAQQFARQVAEWWSEGNLGLLRKHIDPESPQRGMTESDDVRWRQGLDVRTTGIEIAGNDKIAIALVETRGKGVNADRQDFVSESTLIGSPTVVILKRDGNNTWRVLVAGTLGYDVHVDDLTRTMQFAWQDAANEERVNPRILGPPAGTLPRTGKQYVWDVNASNHEYLNLLVESHFSPDGTLGATVISCLPGGVSSGQSPLQITCRKMAQVWSISPTGSVAFSEIHEWQPEPRHLPDPK